MELNRELTFRPFAMEKEPHITFLHEVCLTPGSVQLCWQWREFLYVLGIEFEVKFARDARRALRPTQHPMQWTRGLFILGLKCSWPEAIHLSQSSADLKNAWRCTPAYFFAFVEWHLTECKIPWSFLYLFTLSSHKFWLSFLRYMCSGISVTVVTLDGRWEDLIKIRSNLITRNEVQGNIRNWQATPWNRAEGNGSERGEYCVEDTGSGGGECYVLKIRFQGGLNDVLKIWVQERLSDVLSWRWWWGWVLYWR